ECGIGALLQKRTKGDLLVGHRGDPRVRVACPTQPYSGSPRWPLIGPPAPDSWRSLRRAGQRPPTPSPGTRPFPPAIAAVKSRHTARQLRHTVFCLAVLVHDQPLSTVCIEGGRPRSTKLPSRLFLP